MDTAESETTGEDSNPNNAFARGTLWSSSFHGDRYQSEDIYKVTDHVKVGFNDIFVEPTSLKTGEIGQVLSRPVRKVFSLSFNYTQGAIYYFLTIVCGMFLGLMWGVCFGLLNFLVVWLVHPALKLLFVVIRVLAIPTRTVVRAFLDPLFQAIGQVLSFISAKLRLHVFGLETRAAAADGKLSRDNRLAGSPFVTGGRGAYPSEWLGIV